MLKYHGRLGDRGDTIIEVLFAVVVIGIVLTGGYAVVNRSLLAEFDAQEHSTALGLVQTQIELLRTYVQSNPSLPLPFISPSPSSCMDPTMDPTAGKPVTSSSSCDQTLPPITYQIQVTFNSSNNIYLVSASWPSSINNSIDNLSISYRLGL